MRRLSLSSTIVQQLSDWVLRVARRSDFWDSDLNFDDRVVEMVTCEEYLNLNVRPRDFNTPSIVPKFGL